MTIVGNVRRIFEGNQETITSRVIEHRRAWLQNYGTRHWGQYMLFRASKGVVWTLPKYLGKETAESIRFVSGRPTRRQREADRRRAEQEAEMMADDPTLQRNTPQDTEPLHGATDGFPTPGQTGRTPQVTSKNSATHEVLQPATSDVAPVDLRRLGRDALGRGYLAIGEGVNGFIPIRGYEAASVVWMLEQSKAAAGALSAGVSQWTDTVEFTGLSEKVKPYYYRIADAIAAVPPMADRASSTMTRLYDGHIGQEVSGIAALKAAPGSATTGEEVPLSGYASRTQALYANWEPVPDQEVTDTLALARTTVEGLRLLGEAYEQWCVRSERHDMHADVRARIRGIGAAYEEASAVAREAVAKTERFYAPQLKQEKSGIAAIKSTPVKKK